MCKQAKHLRGRYQQGLSIPGENWTHSNMHYLFTSELSHTWTTTCFVMIPSKMPLGVGSMSSRIADQAAKIRGMWDVAPRVGLLAGGGGSWGGGWWLTETCSCCVYRWIKSRAAVRLAKMRSDRARWANPWPVVRHVERTKTHRLRLLTSLVISPLPFSPFVTHAAARVRCGAVRCPSRRDRRVSPSKCTRSSRSTIDSIKFFTINIISHHQNF